jgi:hypothetical protein
MEKKRTVIMIDGQLTASDLDEVRRVRKSAKGEIALNLSGLETCDDVGLRLLQDWLAGGAVLQRATPFLRMVLKRNNAERRANHRL